LIEHAVLGQQLPGLFQQIQRQGAPDYQFC
jgi:hypothetical protein